MDCGLLELMKTDSAPRRCWLGRRIQDLHDLAQDLHDCRLMHVQSGGELFLKRSEFPRELRRAAKCLAHFRKGSDNKNVDSRSPERLARFPNGQYSLSNGVPARRIHLNSARAVQDIRGHQRTVFGEGIWQIFDVLAPFQGHKL